MDPTIHSVGEKVSVEKLARLMRTEHIQRVIVERRGRVVGLVSAFDLLAVLAAPPKSRSSTKAARTTKKK